MKVAISSSGQNLNSLIDPRFGRCAYFLMVETDDMSFEVFDNKNVALGGGAGIQSAQFVISKGAKAVITGNCGPNAVQVFSAGGVKIFLGVTGTIKKAVEKYQSGDLEPTDKINVPDQSGLVGGADIGRRMGMGRRRGMGSGRNMT